MDYASIPKPSDISRVQILVGPLHSRPYVSDIGQLFQIFNLRRVRSSGIVQKRSKKEHAHASPICDVVNDYFNRRFHERDFNHMCIF